MASDSILRQLTTSRYARNIALGRGFVFNIGEPVFGTTTPLYTLLLAALSLIWPNLPVLSHVISVLAWMICVPITFGIGPNSGRIGVGFMAAAFPPIEQPYLAEFGQPVVAGRVENVPAAARDKTWNYGSAFTIR